MDKSDSAQIFLVEVISNIMEDSCLLLCGPVRSY